jgi:hypothetical protein
MKKLMPITLITLLTLVFLCSGQVCTYAGTTLKVSIQIEIPDFVRADNKEHKYHKPHDKKPEKLMKADGSEEDFNAVAEIPDVESNCNWDVVVMKDKDIIAAGANKDSIANSAENAIAILAEAQNGKRIYAEKQTNEMELAYVFFAD